MEQRRLIKAKGDQKLQLISRMLINYDIVSVLLKKEFKRAKADYGRVKWVVENNVFKIEGVKGLIKLERDDNEDILIYQIASLGGTLKKAPVMETTTLESLLSSTL